MIFQPYNFNYDYVVQSEFNEQLLHIINNAYFELEIYIFFCILVNCELHV